MNLLSISMRNLRIRLLSSSITMVSIALGTALLAAIWLMMDEARKRYSASTSNKSYTAIIGPKEGSPLELVLNTVFNYGISQGLVPYSLYRELHSGRLRKKGMVIYAIPQARGDNFKNFPIIGTTDEMFTKFRTDLLLEEVPGSEKPKRVPVHLKYAEGSHWKFTHKELEAFVVELAKKHKKRLEWEKKNNKPFPHVHDPIPKAWRKAVIGWKVADKLGMKVGSTFVPVHGMQTDLGSHLHPEAECTVVGVLEKTGTPLDRSIYIPLNVFLSMDQHEAIRATQDALAENVGLSAVIVKSARVTAAQQIRYEFQERREAQAAFPFNEINRLLQIVGDSTKVLEVISYIVLLVTASTVLLGLYNTMNERRREIAIMRSLGARRGQISWIILQEALLISLAAGVLGIGLCHLGVFLATGYVEARTGISVDWFTFSARELYLVLGVGILGSIAGVLPAIKGARVPVAENLGPTS